MSSYAVSIVPATRNGVHGHMVTVGGAAPETFIPGNRAAAESHARQAIEGVPAAIATRLPQHLPQQLTRAGCVAQYGESIGPQVWSVVQRDPGVNVERLARGIADYEEWRARQPRKPAPQPTPLNAQAQHDQARLGAAFGGAPRTAAITHTGTEAIFSAIGDPSKMAFGPAPKTTGDALDARLDRAFASGQAPRGDGIKRTQNGMSISVLRDEPPRRKLTLPELALLSD